MVVHFAGNLVAAEYSAVGFDSGLHHLAAVLPYATNPALVPHSPENTHFRW
jgi:ADP-heptose:LPS heptosyltransferase